MYINQCISNAYSVKFQLVQQCIQISTRINILQCTYVHTCLFHLRQPLQTSEYSTWCQNRGCSYISSRRENLQVESSSSLLISKHPECFYSRITILLILQKREEDSVFQCKVPLDPGLQGSSTTQQNLHSMWQQGSPGSPCIFPCCSKASRAQFPVSPSILHDRIFILCSHRCPAVPCGVPVLQ